jgi:hypothetical protein
MTDYPIILDPATLRRVLAGSKTQACLLGVSPLRDCQPGDRLWVKESCIGGKTTGTRGERTARISRADYIVFKDGWRQFPDGSGRAGLIPTGREVKWTTGIHMPRWATRTMLIVGSVRRENLHDLGTVDMVAEGQFARFAGWYWQRHNLKRGIRRDLRAAFATIWDATHSTRGERWDDNPEVVVLTFRLEQGPAIVIA